MPDHFTDEEVEALKAGLENLIEQRIDLLARIGLDPSRLSTISDTAGWINKAADAIRRLLARLEQAEARVKELEAALRLFVRPDDETMEGILWGDMPDDAPGSITIKLRDIRIARAALKEPKP